MSRLRQTSSCAFHVGSVIRNASSYSMQEVSMMCLYCPTCGIRDACEAYQKYHVAVEMFDVEWAEELLAYCDEITTEHIDCLDCHAR